MNESLLLEQLTRYYNLWRESIQMYEEWSKKHGLSYNTLMVLYSLYENREECTQKLISQKWLIPKQTVNTILKDLEQKNMIQLLLLPSDKRNKIIHLTPKGDAYTTEVISKLRKLELYVTEHMGLERITALNNDMALFNDFFCKGAVKYHEQM